MIQLEPKSGESYLQTNDILKVIEQEGSSIALILFSGVQYYTGQFFDIKAITDVGHAQGCSVGWDLAHAVGNVPLKLHEWEVDFACWCSYKYLNASPGGIGGIFVHNKHATNSNLPRFAGWWGHDKSSRFDMDHQQFQPISGAFGFRCSNPPVLCIAPLLASLQIFQEAGIIRLRNKSLLLTAYLEYLLKNYISSEIGMKILTPSQPISRGCQLSLFFPNHDVSILEDKMKKKGIICDKRKPNVIRVSPVPLYNSFHDVFNFIQVLKDIL